MGDLIKQVKERQVKLPESEREEIIYNYRKIEDINKLLSQRELIKWENPDGISVEVLRDNPKTSEALSWERNCKINFRITLTLTGYDLGRKYNHWWSRSGLWFAEYKEHWFWLIVGFPGGILGTLLVNWLS